MYHARIVEALASQFPRLARLLGPEEFAELASAYISAEPSRHPSLRYVGERLPVWLRAHRPESSALIGLAALEWARTDVFDLADEATMTLGALRSWPVERFGELPLHLVTAHRLVAVPVGTAGRWDALGTDLVKGGTDPLDDATTETLVVWREGTLVYHRIVDEAERAALELAARGTRFGIVCGCLLATHADEAAIAQAYAWMSTWLADGLLRFTITG